MSILQRKSYAMVGLDDPIWSYVNLRDIDRRSMSTCNFFSIGWLMSDNAETSNKGKKTPTNAISDVTSVTIVWGLRGKLRTVVGDRRDCHKPVINRQKTNAQYTPPTPTRRNCFVASTSAVWTQFATSSRRLPTDSVDNLETDQTDSIAFDYTNFDRYW